MGIEDILAKIRATAGNAVEREATREREREAEREDGWMNALTGLGARGVPNVRHSRENPDWQTPPEDVDGARMALGGHIDLDVFSCASGNARVGAADYLGPDHPDPARRDGFDVPWIAGTIYANHPGGTTKRAWQKTCAEYALGNFRALVWMAFSVEQICILSDPHVGPDGQPEPREVRWARGVFVPTDFSVCFLRARIGFVDARNPDRRSAPAHANAIIGVGTDVQKFELAYNHRGQCVHGPLAGTAR